VRLNTRLQKRRQAISLTPLIDVVFILLLFFMLSSSFVPWRQINVSMSTQTQTASNNIVSLELVDNKGQFVFESDVFFMSDRAALKALVARLPDSVFLIKAKLNIETGVLVALLDELTLAGAKNVSISAALKGK
jgi:biopolymer transport protein ExbD